VLQQGLARLPVAGGRGVSGVEGRGVRDPVRCGEPGRGAQPPLREAHPLSARICAGCPVRRPCAQDALVDNDQNHLRAGILLPAESMRPAWLRARRALLRVADGIRPCPVNRPRFLAARGG